MSEVENKAESFETCPYNIAENSCPNCEREDCPTERALQKLYANVETHPLAKIYAELKKEKTSCVKE